MEELRFIMANDGLLSKPFPTKRAFEEIADQIRNLIYAEKLRPGDKLAPERELAVRFRAGRMVVREALRVLEQSGMIYVKKGSEGGSFVRDVDTSPVSGSLTEVIRRAHVSLGHLTEVRILVEKSVIGVAIARITEGELVLLKEHVHRAEELTKEIEIDRSSGTFNRWAECNMQFHLAIARATRNPLLEMVLESLMNVTQTFLTGLSLIPRFLHDHVNDHRAIYEAVRDKDLRLAERRLEQHSLELEKSLSYRSDPADEERTRRDSAVEDEESSNAGDGE